MKKKERIPLLKDHHTHPWIYSSLSGCLDIRFIEDKAHALELIGSQNGKDELIVVIGWNDSRYHFSPEELNAFPPLVIMNTSLHCFVMNRAAEAKLGLQYPEITANLEDREWLEKNAAQSMGFIMGIKPCNVDRISSFYGNLARQGVWYAEEMTLTSADEIEIFDRASLSDRTLFWADMATFISLGEEARARVHGIKLFTDGALGARTAKLAECYLSGEEGVLVYDDGKLLDQLALAAEWHKAVAIHAIGDRAIEQTVDTIARLEKGLPETRIEHCQFISRTSAAKAKSMGIVLCMQPNFSFESDFYRDRLPEKYLALNNPFRMLIDDAGYIPGKDLLFGSDGMPHGAQYALESALFPPVTVQELELSELVSGYCMPDFENGFIDISIDYENRKIFTEVTLKGL
jgi:predicted amidohydrolase YtcJ